MPSTNEKSSTKIFVLHPPDLLIVLLQYKFGDVPENEDFMVSSRGESIFFKLKGLFFLNSSFLKSSTNSYLLKTPTDLFLIIVLSKILVQSGCRISSPPTNFKKSPEEYSIPFCVATAGP